MSLIHDALRKARREASHQDDPGVVYPGGLTGPHRRAGLGTGLIIGVALSLIVGAGLVGVGWWILSGSPAEPPAEPTITAVEAQTDTAVGQQTEPSEPIAQPAPNEQETAGRSEIDPTLGDEGVVAGDSSEPATPAETTVIAVPVDTAEDSTSSPTAQERVFDVDADLGYAVLSLDYIVSRANDSYAQINGYEVRVGTHIEGFTVEEITADQVRLVDDNGPLVLRVPENLFEETEEP